MQHLNCDNIGGMIRDEANYRQSYRRTIHGRAKSYLSYLKRRCAKKGLEFNLTFEWLVHRLENGRCEQTGIPFNFDSLPYSNRSPWAFSIDRIDPSKGYTVANSQAVVWAYNAAKGEGLDEDVMFLAKCLLGVIPFDQRGQIKLMPFNNRKK